jgi:hypothetical protein
MDWKIEDSTLEPANHIPAASAEEYEKPNPNEERLEEARERLEV